MRYKIIILLLVVSFSKSVIAQMEWAPIGAEWYYGYYNGNPENEGYFHYKVILDTILFSQSCRQIEVLKKEPSGNELISTMYTYEQNDSIFLAFENDEHFRLIMDFGLDLGDTIRLEPLDIGYGSDSAVAILDALKIENIDGNNLTKYSLRKVNEDNLSNIFCGLITEYFSRIGHMNGFHSRVNCEVNIGDYDILNFRCYSDSTINIQLEDCDFFGIVNSSNEREFPKIKLFPNPTIQWLNIESDLLIEQIDIYNIKGKLLYQDHPDLLKVTLDCSDLLNGQYVLGIKSNGLVKYQIFVKN